MIPLQHWHEARARRASRGPIGSKEQMRARDYATSPTRRERELVRDIRAKLVELPSMTSPAPASPWLVHALSDLFGCEKFAAYRPARDATGVWRLGPRTDMGGSFYDEYDDAVASVPAPFGYDPLHPEEDQRNRVRLLRDLHTHGPDETCMLEEHWPRIGLGGYDQLRALVCDGPVLLSWVGGFRQEPFTAHESKLFSCLLPSLERSLSLQRRLLDAHVVAAGLEAALETLGPPSVIASATGEISHASTSARALLAHRPGDTHSRIREAILRRPDDAFVARIDAPGAPECYLVVLRDADRTLAGRLREARARWRLTPRECDVLRPVVTGEAGKEIALKLGMHDRSVERHMTNILRKARCDSRSRLIARFWTAL